MLSEAKRSAVVFRIAEKISEILRFAQNDIALSWCVMSSEAETPRRIELLTVQRDRTPLGMTKNTYGKI